VVTFLYYLITIVEKCSQLNHLNLPELNLIWLLVYWIQIDLNWGASWGNLAPKNKKQVLCAAFLVTFWWKKYIRTKNARVKCWWNWHLRTHFVILRQYLYIYLIWIYFQVNSLQQNKYVCQRLRAGIHKTSYKTS